MTVRLRMVAALFALALGHANAGVIYSVEFDTSGFDPSGNRYQLDVNLTAGNGAGDAASVTLDNFSCTSCPNTAQTLTDSTFTQDLYIPFTAGGTVAFDLTLNPDLTDLNSSAPDSFQLSILDQFNYPVTTTDLYDAVLFAAFDSTPVARILRKPGWREPIVRGPAGAGDAGTKHSGAHYGGRVLPGHRKKTPRVKLVFECFCPCFLS